ncbi:MAG: putative Acyl-CoA dehydrogenase [Frankiales bacterium]|nr:putative Acyl-CoA dehydrogenase [Frankiales bacterium]
MDLMPSDDQRSIIASVRELLTEQLPTLRVRELAGADLSELAVFWKQAAELGWFGLGLDEELGGTGYDLADEALLFREIGRFVTPGPILATVLGARVAALAGNPDLAQQLLSGQSQAALAVVKPGVPLEVGTHVRGDVVLVDAKHAAHLLVLDQTGAALVPAAACTDRRPAPPIDDVGSREYATLDGDAAAYVDRDTEDIYQRGQVLTTAVLVGIAEGARDIATEYAKTRVQFGKPIGVNQAIKHSCADMAVGADAAVNQLLFAALSTLEKRPDAAFQVAAARVVAEQVAMANSRATIQVFGGMGFTAECDAHLYLKRTHVLGQTFGGLRGAQTDLLAQPAAQ